MNKQELNQQIQRLAGKAALLRMENDILKVELQRATEQAERFRQRLADVRWTVRRRLGFWVRQKLCNKKANKPMGETA